MKTITIYTLLLVALSFAACSKKSSSNENDSKYPDNIASTWSRTISTNPTGIEDTFTTKGADERWKNDMVILSNSEISKLQTLIQSIPNEIRNNFAGRIKKYNDAPLSSSSFSSQTRPPSPEYEELYNFCIANKHAVLPLAMGYLFNDADEIVSALGNTTMAIIVQNEFANLKQEVEKDMSGRKYTEDGLYKVNYTYLARQRRLAKKILTQL